MKGSLLFFVASAVATQTVPVQLPGELFSDVNKGPSPAVNIFVESDDGNNEGKQIQISQQLASHYGGSNLQTFGARRNYRTQQSFLKSSPGGASAAAAQAGSASATGAGASAGALSGAGASGSIAQLVSQLSGLLDRVAASGSASQGSAASSGAHSAPLSQEMMARQGKIVADLESAAIMHSDAQDVWADSAEKSLKREIRAAMKSSPPKTTTLGKMRSAIFGGSRAASFLTLSPADAKVSASELQQIAADVSATVASEFAAPRVNARCPVCANVNYGSCPEGFAAGVNGVCTPTESYAGFCNRSFLNSGSSLEKQEWEYTCDSCFPCA